MADAAARGSDGPPAVVIHERLLRDGIRAIDGSTGHEPQGRSGPFALSSLKSAAGAGHRAAAMGSQKGLSAVQQLELWEVECLVLSYKRIGRISNLVGVDRLVKLHLDNNSIRRIENLGHLRSLKWLDLSFNEIAVIEGLEELPALENLSLYANRITEVQGLEAQAKTLKCLSVGRNLIEGLDDTAKYLHGMKHLRMLTLSGNRIDQAPNYRSRLIGYVSNLKYLDSRTVFRDERDKALEDNKEHLVTVDEQDKKADEAAGLASKATDERAYYDRANIFDDNTVFDAVYFVDVENARVDVGDVMRDDVARDRVGFGGTIDAFKEVFVAKAKSLADVMKKTHETRQRQKGENETTLTGAKTENDDACKELIRKFERRMQAVIPFGLRARPEGEIDPSAMESLRSHLSTLKSDLMEREADQVEAIDGLNKGFDEAMDTLKAEALEQLSTGFEDLRRAEAEHFGELSNKFLAWHDERQRAAQDAEHGYAGEALPIGSNPVLQALDSRDDFTKALSDWHEAHTKKLDDFEGAFAKREEARLGELQAEVRAREHRRNRARVQEIMAYVERIEQAISQWEAMAEQ